MTIKIHLYQDNDQPFTDADLTRIADDLPAYLDNCVDQGILWALGAYAERRAQEHWDKSGIHLNSKLNHYHLDRAEEWLDLRNDLINLYDRHTQIRSN